LDLQMALSYPASRSRSATNRSAQARQPPAPAAAARVAQEQTPPGVARICLTASSVSALIRLSAELVLANASYTSASTHAFVTTRHYGAHDRDAARTHKINWLDEKTWSYPSDFRRTILFVAVL
jgi:hypothetical protein